MSVSHTIDTAAGTMVRVVWSGGCPGIVAETPITVRSPSAPEVTVRVVAPAPVCRTMPFTVQRIVETERSALVLTASKVIVSLGPGKRDGADMEKSSPEPDVWACADDMQRAHIPREIAMRRASWYILLL